MSVFYPYVDPCAFACLVMLTLSAAWIDWRRRIIPNRINFCLLVSGLAYGFIAQRLSWSASIGGSVAGAGALWMLATTFSRIRGYEGLGMGDVKFVAGAGAWVGWQGLAPLLMIASLTALLAIASLRIVAGRSIVPTARVPFAPFLGLALIAVWLVQAGDAAFSMGSM
jgi:leader peptidase (prepilin peptidase) / N-methyltransferase